MENTSNLKRTNGAVGNFKSGSGGGGLPLPNAKRFALWQAVGSALRVDSSDTQVAFGPFTALDLTNDYLSKMQGGTALLAAQPAASGKGPALLTQSSEIVDPVNFYGQPFASPTEKIRFLTAVTFTDNAAADNNFLGLCSYNQGPPADTNSHGIDPLSSYQTGPFSAIIVTPTPAPDALGLLLVRHPANAPLTTWKFASAKAGATTVVDTGIAIVSGQRVVVEIVMQNGVASMRLNGKPAGAITTNLPTLPLELCWTGFTDDPAFIGPGLLGDFMAAEYLYAEVDTP